MKMTVTEEDQLFQLLDLVHDGRFDVETVVLDPESKSVTFRVEPDNSSCIRDRSPAVTMTVKNVEELTVKDTERIGYYDINEIIFDPATRTLLITGGVPVEIVFRVTALEILVEGGQP